MIDDKLKKLASIITDRMSEQEKDDIAYLYVLDELSSAPKEHIDNLCRRYNVLPH